MGDSKKPDNKSRRWFLTGGMMDSKKEKVIVEVDKAVLDAASKQKAGNKEILQWMQNPSKNDQ